jgi:hypothetical protein
VFKYIYRSLSSSKIRLSLLSLVIFSGVVADREKPVLSNQIDSDPYSYTVALQESRTQSNQVPKTSLDFDSTPESALLSKGDTYGGKLRIAAAITGNQGNIFTNQIQPSVSELSKDDRLVSALKSKNSSTTKTALLPPGQTLNTPAQKQTTNNYPRDNGVYLYGQSPEAGQNGQGYVVFEKQQNKVTGAMYMPNSEYSCFQGTVDDSGELAMTVDGSQMEGTSLEVASGSSEPSLDDPNQPTNYAYNLALRDYHRLGSVSQSDRQILQACRENN